MMTLTNLMPSPPLGTRRTPMSLGWQRGPAAEHHRRLRARGRFTLGRTPAGHDEDVYAATREGSPKSRSIAAGEALPAPTYGDLDEAAP